MTRIIGAIARFGLWGLAISSAGCSATYMPIEDEFVVSDYFRPSDMAFGSYWALICMPDQSMCGRRKVNPDLYDPDAVTIDYDGYEIEADFESTGAGNEWIEGGAFHGLGPMIGPDALRSVRFNDYDEVPVDAPPRPQVVTPAENAELHRSELSSLRVEWLPASTGFQAQWKVFPLDNEVEELPCDKLSWGSFEGEGIDSGNVDVPMDVIPVDLPPEGCLMAVRVSYYKSFGLPSGINHGSIRTTLIDGVVFRIKP